MASPALFQLIVQRNNQIQREKTATNLQALQAQLQSAQQSIQNKHAERMQRLAIENQRTMKEMAFRHAKELANIKSQIDFDAKKQIAEMALDAEKRTKMQMRQLEEEKWKGVGADLLKMSEMETDPKVKANMMRMGKFSLETGQNPELMKDMGLIKEKPSATELRAERDIKDAERLDIFSNVIASVTPEQLSNEAVQRELMKIMKGSSISARREARQWLDDTLERGKGKKMDQDMKSLLNNTLQMQKRMLADAAKAKATGIGDPNEVLSQYMEQYNSNVVILNKWYEENKQKSKKLPLLEEVIAGEGAFGKLIRKVFGGEAPTKIQLKPTTPPGQAAQVEMSPEEKRFNQLVAEGKTEQEAYQIIAQEMKGK